MNKLYIVEPLPNCHPEIGRLLWMLEDCRQETQEVLTGIDPNTIDRTSGLNNHSISTILYHIAAIEIDWLAEEVAEADQLPDDLWEHFPFDVRDEAGNLTSIAGLSMQEHLHRLDYTRKLVLQIYSEMSIEEFRRPRHFEAYDVTPEWVLHHLMQHEAGHREEICMLRDLWAAE